jgi:ABC-2 type transport system ATP-binding protein
MLTGLTRPTSGDAEVLGYGLSRQLSAIKKHTGVVPESSNLYPELSAFDNLLFSAQLYGVAHRVRTSRANELLARFGLSEKRDVLFAKLSKGMKRALTVAAALVHRPALLFLDEPTTGLDVLAARRLRAMIADLRAEGVTVFLTTHYLEEAERLCDRIGLIVRGRLVALDTVDGLKATASGGPAVEITLDRGGGRVETQRISGEDVGSAMRDAASQVEAKRERLVSIRTVRPTLEDVFVRLTGLSAEVMLEESGGKGRRNAKG